ncbi:MAG: hypothetical protein IKL29_04145, partial [Bacteroidaceae bacterium]|nr:hypothetical protein [Bacteroidaceae bacterium]
MRKLLSIILFIVAGITAATAQSSTSALLPYPLSIEIYENKKPFDLARAQITTNQFPEADFLQAEFENTIERRTGIKIHENNKKTLSIEFILSDNKAPEEYSIDI